ARSIIRSDHMGSRDAGFEYWRPDGSTRCVRRPGAFLSGAGGGECRTLNQERSGIVPRFAIAPYRVSRRLARGSFGIVTTKDTKGRGGEKGSVSRVDRVDSAGRTDSRLRRSRGDSFGE